MDFSKQLLIFIILVIFLCVSFVNSIEYSDCNIYGNCQPISKGIMNVNYSLVNVNDSTYWQGHTGTDGSWLTNVQVDLSDYYNKTDSYALGFSDAYSVLDVIPNSTTQLGFIQSPFLNVGSKANYLFRSEDFGTTWVRSSIGTITNNNEISPLGTLIAERINGTAAGGRLRQVAMNSSGGCWTFSVYLKGQYLSGGNISLFLNSTTEDGTNEPINVTLRWKRFAVTNCFTGGGNITAVIIVNTNNISAWGAQLDPYPFARSYYPTTSVLIAETTTSYMPLALTVAGAFYTASTLTVSGTSTLSGNLGVGTTYSSDNILTLQKTFTNNINNVRGTSSQVNFGVTNLSLVSKWAYGTYSGIDVTSGTNESLTGKMVGGLYQIKMNPTKNIVLDEATGFQGIILMDDATNATITDAKGFEVTIGKEAGSLGNFTNTYGGKINELNGTTNNYGLYIEDQFSALNNKEIFLANSGGIFFRGTNLNISSQADGFIDFNSNNSFRFNQNLTVKGNQGLTGNYSVGECWQYFTGGILTSTNCTVL